MARTSEKNMGWRRLFAPLLGGISVFDLGTMTLLAGLFYHLWGEGVGDDLAKQFGVEPPTSKAFETAAGSFAALVAGLGWTTLKNVTLNIWHTELGRPTCQGALSVLGMMIRTGVVDAACLIAFPAVVAMLGQRYMEQDSDDQLEADIAKLTRVQQSLLFLEALAAVYTADYVSTSAARKDGNKSAESAPLIISERGRTVGGWLWSKAETGVAWLSSRVSCCNHPSGTAN